ncbi:hypothetical protein [Bradyrhizobium sp. dw_78]|uniref:hypothetical protein n=1 Tax=Bradyrhizobium sp. dw_78 TaxID=2719793 RepID=UPI001BD535B8|nr:hypothetical protein [Bradyrhizobium sp. dw_78]
MVKNLELDDFRAVRRVLEPDDFALTDGQPDPPPSDLIEEQAWCHIMTLPDDVAIRTTSFQGSRISLLSEIVSDWIQILPEPGIMASAMLDVSDAFYSSTFNQMHGFYKESISALRSALETIMLATHCSLTADEDKWRRWMEGEELRFGNICDQILTLPNVRSQDTQVLQRCGAGLFLANEPSNRTAWARTLYRRLCRYSHARGDATNAEMWNSTGPIYSAEGFRASYHFFLEVHALCLILAKYAESTLQISKTAALVLRPDSIELYLEEPHRSVCSALYSALWP